MADEKDKKIEADKEKKSAVATTSTEKKRTTTAKKTESKSTKSSVKEEKAKTENKEEKAKTVKAEVKKDDKVVKEVKNEKESNNEELVAKATVKYERISSRKVKIVADLIRGKDVDEAMAILKFTNKAGSEVLIKLLKSAIANAENNNQMVHNKLYVAEIYSNQGPTLKRIRPAAKGSASRIRKRTSHTTIVLKERD